MTFVLIVREVGQTRHAETQMEEVAVIKTLGCRRMEKKWGLKSRHDLIV